MIELVSRDLQHDLDAYRASAGSASRTTRNTLTPDADRERWLQERCATLQERMHKRRQRDLDGAGSGLRKLFSLFGL